MAGVSSTAVARVVGIDTNFVNLNPNAAVQLPQQVGLVGQGNEASSYSTAPLRVTSAAIVGQTFGFGSPLHLATLELLPPNGGGLGTVPLTLYPLESGGGSAAATGTITVTSDLTQDSTVTLRIRVSGILSAPFTVLAGTVNVTTIAAQIVTAITVTPNMPVTATNTLGVVTMTTKWQGISANDVQASLVGDPDDLTLVFGAFGSGVTDPDFSVALDQITDRWETQIVSCFSADNTATVGALDVFQVFGEARWDVLVHKPCVVTTGENDPSLTNVTTVTDSRKDDRVNSLAYVQGSENLPLQLAARQVSRLAVIANNNPAVDYARQPLTGILSGTEGEQFTVIQRDLAVSLGASTTVLVNGVVVLSDTITMYHPDGEVPPAFRYVVDIVKLQNIIYNLNLIFDSAEWDGAPLIPDLQATTNEAARSPKDAKAAVNRLLDSLALLAIISDPETAKLATTADIDTGNNKRLNVGVQVQLSGNVNIIDVALDFGFFFGTLEVV